MNGQVWADQLHSKFNVLVLLLALEYWKIKIKNENIFIVEQVKLNELLLCTLALDSATETEGRVSC